METKENLKERLKHQVMERMDISRTMEDEEILELVQKTLEEDSHRMPMSISMRQNLIREIFHSLRRLDILQDLIEDADITEIMVNGTKGIFYEKAGRLYQWDKHFTSEEKLQDVIMPWEQEKKDAAVEEKPITRKKKGYWKKYEIDTIEKDDEYYKKDAQSRGWNMAMEEKLQECIAAISRIPAFLTGKINHEKEEEPIVCTPMDYKEMQEENPTVYLGTERAPEGVLRYDGKEDISNIRMEYFPFIIGSSEQADGNVCIQGVSRMHARITREKEDYYVEDLNSMNGTWLNGKMLAYREKEQLCMNDVIQLGRERFTFL